MSDLGDGSVVPDVAGTVVPGIDGAPPFKDPPPGTPAARLMGAPLDFDFGTVNTGTAARTNPFVIMNVGDAQSHPLQTTLGSAGDIMMTANCDRLQLKPGETCVVTATFDPRSVGMHMATASVTDGTPSGVVNFVVRGTTRLGPDAGPDVPRPLVDAGPPTDARDAAAIPVDVLPRDAGAEAPRPDAASDTGGAADTRD